MTYWDALYAAKKKNSYIIYTVIDGIRFSYINQYKSAYEYEKLKYIKKRNLAKHITSYDITQKEVELIKESLNKKDITYYQKEKLDPQQGWVCYYRAKEADDEILHLIITSEWECV